MVYGLNDQTNLLALSNLHGFGKKTVIKVFNELEDKIAGNPYMTVESLSDMLIDLELKMNDPHYKSPTLSELEAAYDKSKEIIERSKKLGIKIICYGDADYPK